MLNTTDNKTVVLSEYNTMMFKKLYDVQSSFGINQMISILLEGEMKRRSLKKQFEMEKGGRCYREID